LAVQRKFGDERLWNSVGFMLFFVFSSLTLEVVLGMGIALLLHQRLPARRLLRSVIILPIAIAPLMARLAWRS
jgi:multiple sugar transport system permease protein